MTQLLTIRETIKSFYSRYENYCRPALRFILAFVCFSMINRAVGYASVLTSLPVVLILALICSAFPTNFILIVSVLMILLHLYALSLEAVVMAACIFLLMFLMYFRFAPKDTILLLLTPAAYVLKIPYAIPICAGLVGTPTSVISVGCGIVSYHLLHYISGNRAVLSSAESDTVFALEKLRLLIDALMSNREMQVQVVAFAVTILFVYIIRRLPADHCWIIAMITGVLVDMVVILVGDLRFVTRISIGGLILGSIVALMVALVLQFFVFNVDYSRTEKVQFEDDEYYYYVKAVPKNTVSLAERKVKKIQGSRPDDDLRRRRRLQEGESEERPDVAEYRLRRSASAGRSKHGG